MIETFPVIVYKQGDNLDDAWYLNDEINSIASCLLGIPGIKGRISFSDHVTRYKPRFQISINTLDAEYPNPRTQNSPKRA
jgi:hypothetical protein